jgi:hypothetical protein
MDYFEYKFLPKTPQLVTARRVASDHYANIAQFSQFVVLLGIPLCRLMFSTLVRLLENHDVADRPPNSSQQKLARQSYQKSNAAILARSMKIVRCKLRTEVAKGCGTHEQWVIGLLWSAWLGYLCIAQTWPGV